MNLAPCLLIASPRIQDPYFSRTVVLLWHHDEDGAIGVVLNRALEHKLPDVLELPDGLDTSPYLDSRVSWGGPVETGSGTVVTRDEVPDDEGWNVRGLGVSRSMDVLMGLLKKGEPIMLCLGYAGWGPGQLDDEVRDGGWIYTDIQPELVFGTDPDERYEKALASIGLDENVVWMPTVDE